MVFAEYPKITLLLILIAVLTIVFILATLFTSLTETTLNLSISNPVELGTPEFRTTIESVTLSSAKPLDSEIEMLTDGRIFLDDLIKEINSAKSSVTITNYIFREGLMTEKVFKALEAKAKEGVFVRLLLDAHGSNHAPENKLKDLEEAGVKISSFRPMSFRSLTRLYRRTHMRAIVIDGYIGYTGGLAFNDEWYGDGIGEEKWRDAMFKFRGRMAQATQDQFNALWRQTDGEILSGPKFYPIEDGADAPDNDSYFISLFHSPAPDISADLLDLIWLTISGAQDHILLATPYLTPPEEIISALKKAVERGVRVEVAVPGPFTDTKLIQSATRSYYKTLLDAGIRIYEYQPGRFHEKFLTADGHWSLIGSANMDNRSATLNVENIFGVEDQTLAMKLEKEFYYAKDNAQEVTLENFHPSILKQAYYRTIALFAKQF